MKDKPIMNLDINVKLIEISETECKYVITKSNDMNSIESQSSSIISKEDLKTCSLVLKLDKTVEGPILLTYSIE